jgi:NitT/TauT family transport system substrate-binding protein
MIRIDRRCALALAAGLAGMAMPARAQATRMRLLLNTSYSGPVAFFLLAEQRGYMKDAGIELSLSQGGGAAAIVPQVTPGGFDAGYGDICALIELIARGRPDEGPVAIYTTFNATPLTIAVDAAGPIQSPKDFEGRIITGHAEDAALLMFDLLAAATGTETSKVTIAPAMSGMGGQVADMLAYGKVHGVFGFVNTIIASITPLGVDPRRLRFINFADHVPEMYGNTLFVTRSAYRKHAAQLANLVRALNRGLADTANTPEAAIDALMKVSPGANRDVNLARLVGTLRIEMAHPEGARLGIGDMDETRLSKLIDRIVAVKKLPRKPSVAEVFDRSFLPPDGERVRSLAKR